MAAKLPTDFDILMRKKTPGPGEYSLAATEMKKTG